MGLRNRIRRFLWDRERRRSRRSGVAHYEINGRCVTVAHRRTDVDMAVLEQCFDAGQYEIPEGMPRYRSRAEAFYDRILASGGSPLIVDCGANIGASVAWFAARYPRAHIVAVEPAADNIELLRRNCCVYDVDLRAAAVGPYDGETFLSDPGAGTWAYQTVDAPDAGYRVPVVSIGTILREKPAPRYAPFVLKLDIEGAEKTLFADGAAIDHFPVVIVEPHDWLFPGHQTAAGFFRFHHETGRDFCFHVENIFSIAYARLAEGSP